MVFQHRAPRNLSPRLRQTLRLVVEGKRNAEIADAMRVTEHTVENYVSRILEQLGCRDRKELILRFGLRQK